MSEKPQRLPLWTRGDLDGFFGLMVDNLVQVLLIVDLCRYVAGLSDELIYQRILPGVAISLLVGNVYYGLQARYVARRDANPGCTALPYGINTPSVIAYCLFIMGPIYRSTGNAQLAWQAGLVACLVSGLVEFLGAFAAERLRRATPRAALLGVLAAVGITFIAADFAFRIYTRPLVGILPLAILLLAYYARFRFPWRLPGGLVAVLAGTVIAWGATLAGGDWFGGVPMSGAAVADALGRAGDGGVDFSRVQWIAPVFVGDQIWRLLIDNPQLVLLYLTVSVPMGVINVLGSLQNIESAEAGGDRFATAPSLAVNGAGSIAAALFGSCFPTTIYIGHPGWKALGARSGYSALNGVFFTAIFLLGLGPLLGALIPIEAGAAIVAYIGLIITAQAFQATPREHAPAVAIALFPAMAAIIVVNLGLYFDYPGVGVSLIDVLTAPTPATQWLPGLLTLTGANSSWFVVTLILSAIGVALIERRYRTAAVWAATATLLTVLGAVHAYRVEHRAGQTVIREFFIWQSADDEGAPCTTPPDERPPAPTTAASGAASAPVVPGARPALRTYASRAWPVAVGYGLATLVFASAAVVSARRADGPEQTGQAPAA
jgi:AGZA family xanthine/uracil permease-like MFS transporter